MSFIEEILEVEKDSERLLESTREKIEKALEKEDVEKKRKIASISVEFREKTSKALELQNEELKNERSKSQNKLEKELEEIKEKSSSKKKEAVNYIVSQIL